MTCYSVLPCCAVVAEVQYRRMKALQCRSIDRAAFLMQLFRQVVYVWRIARLMYVSAGTGLSLVLMCKYEAVVLLPYVVSDRPAVLG